MKHFYVTTPIYYVNDRPHIGHCYTTLVADTMARFHRALTGLPSPAPGSAPTTGTSGAAGSVFFLTGTDEHADKVVENAAAHGVKPMEWADRNAAEFGKAFASMGCSPDDFVRTTQPRHIGKVVEYIRTLQKKGDIYLGEYEGWWDVSQEEYLTETTAKENNFCSPVTGKPLVRRTEKNYFFRLSAYQDRLAAHIREHPEFILPEARRNEVLGRLRDGLSDIPMSRGVTSDPATQWGIRMPDDPSHRIYVWIDALFNYLSVVDAPGREHLWPASVHFIAKDILWFHAVIWPCLLMALDRKPPRTVYSHAYWVREGRKMSKSLGNFVSLEVLDAYAKRYSTDALRWYLVTQGPLGATDADFSHAKFVEIYNSDLANGIGNCASRVANMIAKYFGSVPAHGGRFTFRIPSPNLTPADSPANPFDNPALAQSYFDWPAECAQRLAAAEAAFMRCDVGEALQQGAALISRVDGFINATQPFKIAKRIDAEPAQKENLASILYCCAEAVRVASHILAAAMPVKMAQLWTTWGCTPQPRENGHLPPLNQLAAFGGPYALVPGRPLDKGEALFMRADPAEPAPA